MLRLCLLALLVYGGLLATGWLFGHYPVGFIPQQDQGWLLLNVQLPDSSSVQRTREVVADIYKVAVIHLAWRNTISISGISFVLAATSSNFALMFIVLSSPSKFARLRD